jgi:hypothetical protein
LPSTGLSLGARLGSVGGSECLAAVAAGTRLPVSCASRGASIATRSSRSGAFADNGTVMAVIVGLAVVAAMIVSAVWASVRARRTEQLSPGSAPRS